jgi:guanylate kinase
MKPEIRRRGLMLILSSPSGAGKTTLTRMLLQKPGLDLTLSISVTTRERRSSEAHGVHYFFIKEKQFIAMRDGNYYGTPRDFVERVLAQGRDVLFDIDYQGTQQVRDRAPGEAVTIFILPPSMTELRARLERRAEDPQAVIDRRLANARSEIARWTNYDYILVNDDIEQTFEDLCAILRAERLRRVRRAEGVETFVTRLLAE